MILIIILSIIATAAVCTSIFLLLNHRKPVIDPELLQNLQSNQQQNLQIILEQLNQHRHSNETLSSQLGSRMAETGQVVFGLQTKLAQLEEGNKRILDMGKGITELQNILKAPKLRGGIGEIWLAELISQIIPTERFKLQHRFKSGEICDAVIFLRDGLLLSIDSKFSLENFVRMVDAEEIEKAAYKKQFTQDMKKRIDEIAKKYILPGEGTLDIAFMYVPAENVYYQAFIQDEEDMQLFHYAFERHVVPVSPSSFYAYLQVILFGLRGLDIEKSAKDIQKNLTALQGEFKKFRDSYDKVGTHLRHAQQSFEASDKRLGGVENKFTLITKSEQPLLDIVEETTITLLPHED